jgi:hypothetical protein
VRPVLHPYPRHYLLSPTLPRCHDCRCRCSARSMTGPYRAPPSLRATVACPGRSPSILPHLHQSPPSPPHSPNISTTHLRWSPPPSSSRTATTSCTGGPVGCSGAELQHIWRCLPARLSEPELIHLDSWSAARPASHTASSVAMLLANSGVAPYTSRAPNRPLVSTLPLASVCSRLQCPTSPYKWSWRALGSILRRPPAHLASRR